MVAKAVCDKYGWNLFEKLWLLMLYVTNMLFKKLYQFKLMIWSISNSLFKI